MGAGSVSGRVCWRCAAASTWPRFAFRCIGSVCQLDLVPGSCQAAARVGSAAQRYWWAARLCACLRCWCLSRLAALLLPMALVKLQRPCHDCVHTGEWFLLTILVVMSVADTVYRSQSAGINYVNVHCETDEHQYSYD
jgi:hypothetical protein